MPHSTADLAAQLRSMDLLKDVPDPILLELAGECTLEEVPAAYTVFHKNDPARNLYLLISGAIKVHDGDFTVAEMTGGACFGEMALLDEGLRSMSITTTEPTLLASLSREVFFNVLSHRPEVLQRIVSLLTRRLRYQTDQTLAHLRRREEALTREVEARTAELLEQKERAEQLRLKAEEERREAERQRLRAERSEKAEQQFLANMSHEIRTPMNAVMGMTNLLLRKEPRPEQYRYLDTIRQSSETLLVILNDILDISKIQSGKLELENAPLQLSNILETVRTLMQFRAEEKGLQLEVEHDPDIPNVLMGDPVRLQQILINLSGNAVKFTEKGRVTLSARLQANTGTSCRIYFEVLDTGIGMSPEQLAVVFESFKQASTDITRKYGGTGLGLSIAKQLVERFGGRLEVRSEPGTGSAFFFTLELPIAADQNAQSAVVPEQPAQHLSELRILLAEDNPFNQMVAVETLELLLPHARIRSVQNGREALEAVQAEAFDVVLMDVNMPEMDGLEATRLIRRLPPPQNSIPILAFTASVTPRETRRCLDAGMLACIPKPFRESELLAALQAAVPATPSTPNVAAAAETDFLDTLAAGNPQRLRKYIGMYLESAHSAMPKIRAALEARDMEALRRAVHTIKPQLRMFGMPEMADLAQDIETQVLEAREPDSLTERVARLLGALSASAERYQRRLDTFSE